MSLLCGLYHPISKSKKSIHHSNTKQINKLNSNFSFFSILFFSFSVGPFRCLYSYFCCNLFFLFRRSIWRFFLIQQRKIPSFKADSTWQFTNNQIQLMLQLGYSQRFFKRLDFSRYSCKGRLNFLHRGFGQGSSNSVLLVLIWQYF